MIGAAAWIDGVAFAEEAFPGFLIRLRRCIRVGLTAVRGCAPEGESSRERENPRQRCAPPHSMGMHAMGVLKALMLVELAYSAHSTDVLSVTQSGDTLAAYAVASASFGPSLGKGVSGFAEIADPSDACSQLSPLQHNNSIVLAQRSKSWSRDACNFVTKVSNAALAGASAAVIYDYISERLVIMSKEDSDPVRAPVLA